MIVLDTNALRDGALGRRTAATLLWAISEETGHEIRIPAEVLKEYLSDYRREIEKHLNHSKCLVDENEVNKLAKIAPRWHPNVWDGNIPVNVDQLVQDKRKFLLSWFPGLNTPEGAADEGDERERSRRRPALESGKESKGSRDVVIWLTALEAAKSINPNKLYFVSKDHGFQRDAHGKDDNEARYDLHPELCAELHAKEINNLCYVPNVEALLEHLSCKEEADKDLANNPRVLQAISEQIVGPGNHPLKTDIYNRYPSFRTASLEAKAEVTLEGSPEEVVARRIGRTVFTAIKAIYRIDISYNSVPDKNAITVGLGILVTERHGHPVLPQTISARIISTGSIRGVNCSEKPSE